MYISEFHQYMLSEKRQSIHTQEAYLRDIQQFWNFVQASWGPTNCEEVTLSLSRSWMSKLIDDGLSVTTVHRKLASLSSYFKFLMKEGKVDTNPFKSLKKPKKPSRLPQFIEESQSIQIYSDDTNNLEWDGFRSYAIVRVLYETGIRRAELIGLRWNDISTNRKLIRVVGKRNKTREVPISDGMIEFLEIYREKQNAFLMEHQKEKRSEHVFLNDKGQVISVTQLYHSVRTVLSQWTTMRKRSPHILRHSFATHMLNGGADLNVIKEILGHSSLSATQVYTHVNIAKLKGLHSKLHPRSDEK